MTCEVKITDLKTNNEIDGFWTDDDYVKLLGEFDYPDADKAEPSELLGLLELAISDCEPPEAAEIVLNYKLSDELNAGQIQNLSNEMLTDKVAEDYADIALHYPLFNVNQLLYKAYNGKFPNTEASKIELELIIKDKDEVAMTKEIAIKAISEGLNEHNIIKRLYEDQLQGKEDIGKVESIIWELHDQGENKYTIITSDYWINKEDIEKSEFTSRIRFEVEDQ